MFTQREYTEALLPLAEKLSCVIQDKFPCAEVRLFGSVAAGKADAGSDIDLAVFLPQVGDVYARAKKAAEVRLALLDFMALAPIDILVFNKEDLLIPEERRSYLLGEVLKHGSR